MKRLLNSFVYAWNGLLTTWKEELNFRMEILAGVIVVFCIFYFHFSFIETIFCVLAITIVLCAEIINTAIEDICNKIQPNQDEVIGKIKDIMAAFVLLSVLGAVAIGYLVFRYHFT